MTGNKIKLDFQHLYGLNLRDRERVEDISKMSNVITLEGFCPISSPSPIEVCTAEKLANYKYNFHIVAVLQANRSNILFEAKC